MHVCVRVNSSGFQDRIGPCDNQPDLRQSLMWLESSYSQQMWTNASHTHTLSAHHLIRHSDWSFSSLCRTSQLLLEVNTSIYLLLIHICCQTVNISQRNTLTSDRKRLTSTDNQTGCEQFSQVVNQITMVSFEQNAGNKPTHGCQDCLIALVPHDELWLDFKKAQNNDWPFSYSAVALWRCRLMAEW